MPSEWKQKQKCWNFWYAGYYIPIQKDFIWREKKASHKKIAQSRDIEAVACRCSWK